jgi:serine/threonine protein kinase
MQIAIDVLFGIQAIHEIHCPEYESEDGARASDFNMFHLDLTIANVLLTPPDRGAITDFGCATPESIGGTAGFKSPEQIALCHNHSRMSKQEVIDHNIRYGQASDVWSAGLILAALFAWKSDPQGGPPLPCIEDCLRKTRSKEALTADSNIKNLKQREIDENLAALKQECLVRAKSASQKLAVTKIWDIIRRMVQVKSEQRISIREALQELIHIQKDAGLVPTT